MNSLHIKEVSRYGRNGQNATMNDAVMNAVMNAVMMHGTVPNQRTLDGCAEWIFQFSRAFCVRTTDKPIENHKSQITNHDTTIQQYNNGDDGDDGDDGTTADRLLLVALANAHTPASNARVSTVERCY